MKKSYNKFFIVVVLLVCLCLCLMACAPLNAKAAENKLERKGYEVEKLSKSELTALFGMDLNAKEAIAAQKGDNFIMAIWFDSKDDAKFIESSFLLSLELGFESDFVSIFGSDFDCGVKSKVFFVGSKDAIDDLI